MGEQNPTRHLIEAALHLYGIRIELFELCVIRSHHAPTRKAFAMTASLWLPLKRFITSEGFFEVFSLFGLLCSLAVLGLAMLR